MTDPERYRIIVFDGHGEPVTTLGLDGHRGAIWVRCPKGTA
jgi:hypothetical protein